MKLTSTILSDFVHDFKLQTSEFGVCFSAVANFNLPSRHFNLHTDVHMEAVLSGSIDTIYLLNPVVEAYKMPTFFNDANHQFLYLNNAGIIIIGTAQPIGMYSISIIPKSDSYTKKSFDELRGKKLN